MLCTDADVAVTPADYGYLFDGPGTEDLLIFYPGAKVEETAYAPLLRQLADGGMDVALVKMPLLLAVFGADKASEVEGTAGRPVRSVGLRQRRRRAEPGQLRKRPAQSAGRCAGTRARRRQPRPVRQLRRAARRRRSRCHPGEAVGADRGGNPGSFRDRSIRRLEDGETL